MAARDGRNGSDGSVTEEDDNNSAAQAASARQYDWRPRPDPTVLTTQQLRETEGALNRTINERVASLRELLSQRLAGMDKATELLANQVTKIALDADSARARVRDEAAREVLAMRELIESRLSAMDKATELLAATVGRVPSDTDKSITAMRELIEARLEAMDKANELLAANVRAVPSDLDKSLEGLREILQQEIRNVQDVSVEKFTAIEGTFASNALALTAALAAQKEAAAEQNKSNTLAINKSEQATKEASAANVAQTTSSLGAQAANIADLKDRVVRIEAGGLARSGDRTEGRLDRTEVRDDRAVAHNQTILVFVVLASVISIVSVIISAFHL